MLRAILTNRPSMSQASLLLALPIVTLILCLPSTEDDYLRYHDFTSKIVGKLGTNHHPIFVLLIKPAQPRVSSCEISRKDWWASLGNRSCRLVNNYLDHPLLHWLTDNPKLILLVKWKEKMTQKTDSRYVRAAELTGEGHDKSFTVVNSDLLGSFDAIHLGHYQVHQDHVPLSVFSHADGLASVLRNSNLARKSPQNLSHQLDIDFIIFRQQHTQVTTNNPADFDFSWSIWLMELERGERFLKVVARWKRREAPYSVFMELWYYLITPFTHAKYFYFFTTFQNQSNRTCCIDDGIEWFWSKDNIDFTFHAHLLQIFQVRNNVNFETRSLSGR